MKRVSLILTALLFVAQFSLGQNPKYLQHIQDTADKLVASFWGQQNFINYIKLDKKKSTYLIWGKMWDKRCQFDTPLNFTPNFFHYNYYVNHPAFHGDTARIEFYLDSTGKLEIGLSNEGLFQPGNLDKLKTIDKATAMSKAKEYGLPPGKGKWSVSLQWNTTPPETLNLKPNSTLQDYIQGKYVWAVKSIMEKDYRNGCFYFNKRIHYIDLVTGKLIFEADVGEIE
jgi:hypothetical protein